MSEEKIEIPQQMESVPEPETLEAKSANTEEGGKELEKAGTKECQETMNQESVTQETANQKVVAQETTAQEAVAQGGEGAEAAEAGNGAMAASEAKAVEAKAAKTEERMETMEDYAKELEASFKRVKEGDTVTGTVAGVTDDQVLVDLKYYAGGVIKKENISQNPDFQLKQEIHPGDKVTATVLSVDDGEGNIDLSMKAATEHLVWDKLTAMLSDRTVTAVKIAEIVKSGAVAYLEGIRAFIPASKLAAEYVEDLEEYNGKTIEVTVITAEPETKRLVLSGKEPALLKLREEKNRQIAKCKVGAIMEGTVDSLKPYGAFVNLENGLSGLVHISQISTQRIKHPSVVLKEGQTVKVKILSIEDNKIRLSIRAVNSEEEFRPEDSHYHEAGEATTGLGALLKGIQL